MKNTFTKLVNLQNSGPKCLYAFVVELNFEMGL